MTLKGSVRKIARSKSSRLFNVFRRGTQASFTGGNDVTLLKSGSDFFGELFAAIKQAERSIFLEFYIVRGDQTGRHLADLLESAVQRGVEVCLLYDYIGCFDTPASFFRSLVQKGVKIAVFNPPPFKKGLSWFDKRDHRKIAIIDNRTAFAGGMNIGDEYAGFGKALYWRDLGLRAEGKCVGDLLQLFCESWQEETGTLPSNFGFSAEQLYLGEDEVAIVSGGPHHNRSRIRTAFRLAIAGAEKSIRIETPYFVPGPRFIRAMLRAVRRGVKVQLILPARSDVPLVQLVNRSSYSILLRGGIEIYELGSTILHGKLMLIDGRWSVIGSANLDHRSFHRNFEVNVIVSSSDFGRQVEELFHDDLADSRLIMLENHEKRGLLVRLIEKLVTPVSWFL